MSHPTIGVGTHRGSTSDVLHVFRQLPEVSSDCVEG